MKPQAKPAQRRHVAITLGSRRFKLPVGRRLAVRVALNRAGRSLLKHRTRLRVTLHVTATVAKHTRGVRTTTITLANPKPTNKH